MLKRIMMVAVGVSACVACSDSVDSAGATDDSDLTAATVLTCTTAARAREDESLSPRFSLSAQVPSTYRTGAELTGLTAARASAGRPNAAEKSFPSVARDAAYKPRGANKNRARFMIESLDASDESFDGIVHSVILPRNLGASDIDSNKNGLIVFHAIVASSTDSYHDGIISYFKMRCELAPGNSLSNGNDYLSCASRETPTDADYVPSFTFTAKVPAAFGSNGAELTELATVSASAAQAEPTQWSKVASDASYRPRTNLNRNRFNFPAALEASDDQFDGIAHGLILPKTIDRGARSFKGYVISSTDSYHDGIMSYFPMDCRLTR